jgi:astacin
MAADGPKGLLGAALTTVEAIQPGNLAFESSEDGTKFIALRLRREDAAAVRVHISGMHLGVREKLFIYSPNGSRVFGPFQGSGPVESGEFWSEAMAGTDVVVEFQAGPRAAADLPFSIDAIQGVDAPASEAPTVDRPSVANGAAVYEGDIMLGNASEMASAVSQTKTPGRSAVSITGQKYRWPNGTMPYIIASNVPSPERIRAAISHWNTVMAGTVQMVPHTSESNYVLFAYSDSAGTCSSYVGMQGYGSQTINVGNYCSTGNMIHEIGHAWGLWHEHTREDRDRFVTINCANITSGQSYNFTQNIVNGDDLGVYDYNSVMHYNGSSFSANGLPTIETIPAGIPIGQRAALSTGDVAAIRLLYPNTSISVPPVTPPATTAPVTVSFTVTSNPVGSSVTVDSVDYTTPAVFEWTPGSSHTVTANNTVVNGVSGTFASWSDGGAQTHGVTAPSLPAMLKADYVVAYSVTAKAYPVGAVSVTPASADGFYPAGTALTLGASPASGYCFSNWTGLIAGTPNRVNLSATKSYDLQANFQPGSISLTAAIVYPRASGANLTIGISATSGCTWGVYSSALWASITSAESGSGSGMLTISVAPNTTGRARIAQVSVGYKTLFISQSAY